MNGPDGDWSRASKKETRRPGYRGRSAIITQGQVVCTPVAESREALHTLTPLTPYSSQWSVVSWSFSYRMVPSAVCGRVVAVDVKDNVGLE